MLTYSNPEFHNFFPWRTPGLNTRFPWREEGKGETGYGLGRGKGRKWLEGQEGKVKGQWRKGRERWGITLPKQKFTTTPLAICICIRTKSPWLPDQVICPWNSLGGQRQIPPHYITIQFMRVYVSGLPIPTERSLHGTVREREWDWELYTREREAVGVKSTFL